MEVHHHSHTPRKKWTHFIWEFFMLFLAVTAGFFVENLREHRIEAKREKKLMKALLLDLQSDRRQLDTLYEKRIARNRHADSLIRLLSVADKQNGSSLYYYGRQASRRIHFRPQDGTLLQLRNGGGFHVVHNAAVLNQINSYELLLKNNGENIEVEEKELSAYAEAASGVFDVSVFQAITQRNGIDHPAGNPALLTYDKKQLNELAVKLHYWKRTSLSVLESWEKLKKEAAAMEELIKEEYHLE